MEEKIKEMAKILQATSFDCGVCDCRGCKYEQYRKGKFCETLIQAEIIYNAGYRKKRETAREIIADAKKWVKEHHKDKVTDSFGEREMLFMEAFGYLLSYLMEKYGVDLEKNK